MGRAATSLKVLPNHADARSGDGEANMVEQLPAGWYSSGAGVRRYWTGSEWVTPEAPTGPPVDPLPSLGVPLEAPPPVRMPLRARRGRKSIVIGASIVLTIAGGVSAVTWLLPRTPDREAWFLTTCESALHDSFDVSPQAAISDVGLIELKDGETEYRTGFNRQLRDAGLDWADDDDVEEEVDEALAAYESSGTTVLWATGEADGAKWMCRAWFEGEALGGLRIIGFDGDFVPNAAEGGFPANLRDRD